MKPPATPDSSSSERSLVERAVRGDNAAFEKLLEPIEPSLRSLIRSIVRGRPEIEPEDVLQDSRIYIFNRLGRYNPEYPFGVFARALTRTVARRFLFARSQGQPNRSDEEDDDSPGWIDLSPTELSKLPLGFRRVLGEDRFDTPGAAPPSREFLDLLEVFLRWGGYPHQQICFGYSILLWGKRKQERRSADRSSTAEPGRAIKVPVTGDPDRVVREIGPSALGDTSADLLEDIGSSHRLEHVFLSRIRMPLEHRLGMTGGTLFARDPLSLKLFRRLENRVVGETRLREYFGSNEKKSVSDWTRIVKERVRKCYLDPEERKRSSLPQVDA